MEPKLRELSVVVNIIATIDDVIIACMLSFLFQSSKNGFGSTSNILNRLTLHAVNTGAITSICAMSALVSMLAAPKTLIYIAFYFCIGRLYTASLLATLNARNGMRNAADSIQTALGRMSPLAFRSFANERVINKSIFNNQSDIAVDAIDGTQLEMETNGTQMYELYDMSSDNIGQKVLDRPPVLHSNPDMVSLTILFVKTVVIRFSAFIDFGFNVLGVCKEAQDVLNRRSQDVNFAEEIYSLQGEMSFRSQGNNEDMQREESGDLKTALVSRVHEVEDENKHLPGAT
ncbi:uncharacterized protein C8R40DRAFT_1178003 [Lentinula edodes]|uniref:uncharacterized protein n=1 Tax=Lentinula edodes TaxID=5353 RepID=UPI001E8D4795|nr:uncharacterized protein C8R40DRAFT_1178003 [Lentinula edodes]KAH7868260.1 hypothetical protein C8R40DRAFT_1178003 [Lentinula edodes]